MQSTAEWFWDDVMNSEKLLFFDEIAINVDSASNFLHEKLICY